MIGFKPESRDELRERLREMSDLELRRFESPKDVAFRQVLFRWWRRRRYVQRRTALGRTPSATS
jgi:hypothetical protein